MASNAVGTITPVEEIVEIAHAAGALAWVDAVHYAPHGDIELPKVGCDVLLCSPYKFYGPHLGLAVGTPRPARELAPVQGAAAGRLPPGTAYETGTLPHELLCGLRRRVEYLHGVGWKFITEHERKLGQSFLDGLPDGVDAARPADDGRPRARRSRSRRPTRRRPRPRPSGSAPPGSRCGTATTTPSRSSSTSACPTARSGSASSTTTPRTRSTGSSRRCRAPVSGGQGLLGHAALEEARREAGRRGASCFFTTRRAELERAAGAEGDARRRPTGSGSPGRRRRRSSRPTSTSTRCSRQGSTRGSSTTRAARSTRAGRRCGSSTGSPTGRRDGRLTPLPASACPCFVPRRGLPPPYAYAARARSQRSSSRWIGSGSMPRASAIASVRSWKRTMSTTGWTVGRASSRSRAPRARRRRRGRARRRGRSPRARRRARSRRSRRGGRGGAARCGARSAATQAPSRSFSTASCAVGQSRPAPATRICSCAGARLGAARAPLRPQRGARRRPRRAAPRSPRPRTCSSRCGTSDSLDLGRRDDHLVGRLGERRVRRAGHEPASGPSNASSRLERERRLALVARRTPSGRPRGGASTASSAWSASPAGLRGVERRPAAR